MATFVSERWLFGLFAIVLGAFIALLAVAIYFLALLFTIEKPTFTQILFILCIGAGPLLGGLASLPILRKYGFGVRVWMGAGAVFVSTTLAAYFGWYFGGVRALRDYPDYPSISPGELGASLYTLPGLVLGIAAIFVVRWLNSPPAYWKSASTLIVAIALLWFGMALILTGRL